MLRNWFEWVCCQGSSCEVEADCGFAFGKRPFRPFVMEAGAYPLRFPAQRKRFLCDRGCVWVLFRECGAGVRGY